MSKKKTTINDDYEMIQERVYTHFMSKIQRWHEPLFVTRQLVRCRKNERSIHVKYHRSRDNSAYLIGDSGSLKYFCDISGSDKLQLAGDDGVQTELVAFYLYSLALENSESIPPTWNSLFIANNEAKKLFENKTEEEWEQAYDLRFSVDDVQIFRRFSQLLKDRSWRFETAAEARARFIASPDYITLLYDVTILRAASRELLAFTRSMIQYNVQVLQWMDTVTDIIYADDDPGVAEQSKKARIDALVSLSEHVKQCLYDQAKAHFDNQLQSSNVIEKEPLALENRN